MEYVIISTVALFVAALTLFSGFGLGTLLMPAFALFFPIEVAVAATAVVHLANNIFKAILVGRGAKLKIVALFALPAAACAAIGAWLLGTVSAISPIYMYEIGNHSYAISPIKIVIAILILVFAMVELFPNILKIKMRTPHIPLGGALSGFFGGLSGHQGALRTAFLINLGMTKEAFIGTMVLSAIVVDISRISIYGVTFISKDIAAMEGQGVVGLVMVGMIAAFVGSFLGSRLLGKVTMRSIQMLVGCMLIAVAIALGMGII